MDRRLGLKAVSLLQRRVSATAASAFTKYLYLAETLERRGIELVIDVGANIGQFGQALRAIGYRERILSFEPLAEPFTRLQKTAATDAAWEARQLALGDAPGSAELGVARSAVFSSFYTPAAAQPLAHFSEQNVIERHEVVTVTRLDTVIDDLALRPLLPRTLLKCDTQGHDRHVLAGMGYLDEVALLQIEMSALPLYEGTPTMPEMIEYVDSLGFTPIMLSPVNRTRDGRTIEFDYLGVNTRLTA